MEWKLPDSLDFNQPLAERLKPAIENEAEKKIKFGIELGKGIQSFQAACNVCGDNTSEALYICQNWINDPIVLENKQRSVDSSQEELDAEAYAALLLTMAKEKNASNTFYILEGKDRIKCLELYGQAKNFLGKNAIPVNNNITFKTINVKFVKPETKQEKIIEELPIGDNINPKSSLKLKLVS